MDLCCNHSTKKNKDTNLISDRNKKQDQSPDDYAKCKIFPRFVSFSPNRYKTHPLV